jgi:hypothetical protein
MAEVGANTCLNRVAMRNVPHQYSTGCCLFLGRNSKNAAIISEHLSLLRYQFWKNTSTVVIGLPYFVLRPVDEDIFPDRVTMKIQKK